MKYKLPLAFLFLFNFVVAQVPSDWSATSTYSSGALVISNGTTYIAQQDVNTAGTALTNTSYWLSLDSAAPSTTPSTSAPTTPPDTSTVPTTPPETDDVDEVIASGLTSASNEAFVMQQYLDFLGRDGDAEGIAYWTGQLDTSQQTRADCVNNFVFSAEFQEQVAPVSRLYLAYFLRLPDTGGLTYWIDKKLNGMTINEISDAFAGVPEFSDRYGSLDDSGFVNLVYNNVLSRTPDSEGVSYWNGQMNDGMTRGEVMTGFSESPENQQTTLNQIRVIAFYYGMLRRAPDQEGFDYWVAKLNNGEQPNDLINGFINSPEYQGRADRSAAEGGFGK